MAAYVDYVFYSGTYLGAAITPSDFPRLALRASEVIDRLTYDRTAALVTDGTDEATIAKVQMATCAVAEQLQALEASGGAVASEHVGNYSVTYLSKFSDDARMKAAARRYLASSFLMYPGFNQGEGGGQERNIDWSGRWS
jgi:hypothetical protein